MTGRGELPTLRIKLSFPKRTQRWWRRAILVVGVGPFLYVPTMDIPDVIAEGRTMAPAAASGRVLADVFKDNAIACAVTWDRMMRKLGTGMPTEQRALAAVAVDATAAGEQERRTPCLVLRVDAKDGGGGATHDGGNCETSRSSGMCTLRMALELARTHSGPTIIDLAPGHYRLGP